MELHPVNRNLKVVKSPVEKLLGMASELKLREDIYNRRIKLAVELEEILYEVKELNDSKILFHVTESIYARIKYSDEIIERLDNNGLEMVNNTIKAYLVGEGQNDAQIKFDKYYEDKEFLRTQGKFILGFTNPVRQVQQIKEFICYVGAFIIRLKNYNFNNYGGELIEFFEGREFSVSEKKLIAEIVNEKIGIAGSLLKIEADKRKEVLESLNQLGEFGENIQRIIESPLYSVNSNIIPFKRVA